MCVIFVLCVMWAVFIICVMCNMFAACFMYTLFVICSACNICADFSPDCFCQRNDDAQLLFSVTGGGGAKE